jgi:hypothetical protein
VVPRVSTRLGREKEGRPWPVRSNGSAVTSCCADTDDDVVSTVRDRLRTDHPELVDKVSDEQILDWIEIVA